MFEKNRHKRKFINFVLNEIEEINNPNILEFGVSERGMSTELFLNLCEKKNGKLFSIDTNSNVRKFDTKNWKFINNRDDNFDEIEKIINGQIFDIIYLDTIHKAEHVAKILFHYYDRLKKGGYFFIDDTSWLSYTQAREKNNFSIEINNQETFEKLLEIHNLNHKNFDLDFSFVGTGVARITKLSTKKLVMSKKIPTRKYSPLNFMRKIYLNLFKRNA